MSLHLIDSSTRQPPTATTSDFVSAGRIQNAAGSHFPHKSIILSPSLKKKKKEGERELDAAPRFQVGNRKRKMSDTVFQKRLSEKCGECVPKVRVLDSIPTGFGVGRRAPINRVGIDFYGWVGDIRAKCTTRGGGPEVPGANETL